MIQFFKRAFLGQKKSPRANSVEVKSKLKDVVGACNRPMSIDSKEKQQKTALKTGKNNLPFELFE